MTPDHFLAQIPTRAKIINFMTEEHRIYHNLNHAMNLAWLSFKPLENDLADELFYYYAAFYHDIIYVPGNKDNEILSAFEFQKDLSEICIKHSEGQWIAKDVNTTILLSADHFQPDAYIQNNRILHFLDLDLWGLGSDPIEYDLNSKKIRLEFNNVSEEDWIKGRVNWLSTALKSKIYRLALNREGPAKLNMKREYDELVRRM